MAEKAKKIKTRNGNLELKIVNPNAAGIDIADREIQVCVPCDRDKNNNRCFRTYTQDLDEICSWLNKCNIDTASMEATGIYWVSLYYKLREAGIDVILVNARDVKNITEKKTDEADAEWLMLLHTYGLLKASFQPDNIARKIRNMVRHRNNLLKDASKQIQHMQKAMEQMNIKLSVVLADITGQSGSVIIEAIISGERNPKILAELANPRCKCSKDEIAMALEGTWDDSHLLELQQSYEIYKFFLTKVEECDKSIEKELIPYMAVIDTDMTNFEKSKKKVNKKNAISFDVEKYGYATWGVNMMDIPGMSSGSILQLIGELGSDFTSKFDSPEKFCKWCNVVPNNKISGGKLLSSRVPKRKNPVGQIFRLCANTLKAAKNPLGYYFRRIRSRGGYMQAIVATAHKLCRIFYTMAKNKCAYDETKVGLDEKDLLKKKIERAQKVLDRLNSKLSESAC